MIKGSDNNIIEIVLNYLQTASVRMYQLCRQEEASLTQVLF